LVLVCTVAPTLSQSNAVTAAVPRDPQAIAATSAALAALTGNTKVSDVTLTGTATLTSGSETESGSITLTAMGTKFSQMKLVSASGVRTEVHNLSPTGTPQGAWVGLDGVAHPMPGHNTYTDAVWFFPALGVMSQVAHRYIAATYVGEDTREGVSVHHIHLAIQYPQLNHSAKGAALTASLTGTDLYLDTASSLPVAVTFNTHPNNNAATNIPVEVDFSNYQAVNGVQVPFRIRQLLNGTLLYDMTIQSASVNSGLSASNFTAQ